MPQFDILSVHPKMVEGPLSESIVGRARASGAAVLHVHDIRDHGLGRHRTVDDTPYGGGPGMVMRVDVGANAIDAVRKKNARVLLTSPTGRTFNQQMALELLEYEQVVVVCGHYEGIDDRIETLVDECVSLGDFVMTGGEITAVAIADAVLRLQSGVLGNVLSAQDESFTDGLLEYPQYTRPQEWEGQQVPEILLSGHHAKIQAWRQAQKIQRTKSRRPDLYRAWSKKNKKEDEDINVQSVDDSPDVE